jgi:polysaccharide pyruvyl transferase WcaK-like protein
MKVVLLNDTRDQPHFGCSRVMETIEQLIHARGGTLTGTCLTGTDWSKDVRFLENLSTSDAIIINGEGTLHHGASRGELLLQIVDHPIRQEKPVYLINCLYQENPQKWGDYINKIDLIMARDSKSFHELSQVYKTGVLLKGLDLSLYNEFNEDTSSIRSYNVYGDSFYKDITRQLIKLSDEDSNSISVPICRYFKPTKPKLPSPLKEARIIYLKINALSMKAKHPRLYYAKSTSKYLQLINRARFHLTGRFHGACLSLVAKTPFALTTSNSWKMEALIEDVGLSRARLLKPSQLQGFISKGGAKNYSPSECFSISTAIEENRRIIDWIFDQIVPRF